MQDRLIIKPILLRASTMEDTVKWMTRQTGSETFILLPNDDDPWCEDGKYLNHCTFRT
jgi:hypothetical protein